jgi:hypothetical protein
VVVKAAHFQNLDDFAGFDALDSTGLCPPTGGQLVP